MDNNSPLVPRSTVFIVDDDEPFLASLARFLLASGLAVKAFSSAADFLSQCAPDAPGCVVADLQMPEMHGMELQETLAKSNNPLPIIFLTGQGDIPSSVKAMRHGAEDYLTKRAPPEELVAAIQRALARDNRDREERHHRRTLLTRFNKLTPRERQVLAHVLRGHLNKQIAADLGIHERSVKRHRTSLMAKLQVQSAAQLALLAVAAGLSAADPLSPSSPPSLKGLYSGDRHRA